MRVVLIVTQIIIIISIVITHTESYSILQTLHINRLTAFSVRTGLGHFCERNLQCQHFNAVLLDRITGLKAFWGDY